MIESSGSVRSASNPVALPPDYEELLALAARVGSNPSLVQGPGGNVSVKDAGVMWIKASGTWLAQALTKPIMVPVALEPLMAGLQRGDPACESCAAFVRTEINPNGLRPSIETSVHAVMPQRIVVHVHCVETIAWAARADARDVLAPLLDGLSWSFVSYVKPGLSLSQAMQPAVAGGAHVIVLGNHGLVVAADTVPAAEALLDDIVNRLRRPKREETAAQFAHLTRLAYGTDYDVPEDAALHRVATDSVSLRAAEGGSLYPDHVIFLGPAVVSLQDGETVAEAVLRAARPTLPLLLVPHAGILLHRSATAATRALAMCLSDVTGRLGADEPLAYIGAVNEATLLDWDAEKYRQSLDKRADV